MERGCGLGVDVLEATRTALEHGQVDELLLGPDEIPRAELVRPASLTRAMVEAVAGRDGPQRLDGVGALVLSLRD